MGTSVSTLQGGHWREVKVEDLVRGSIESDAEQPSRDHASVLDTPSEDTTKSEKPAAPRKVRLERRQELEHHLKGSPTDLDAFMELGRIYRAENRPADARRVFQQAIQVFPDEPQVLWEYEEAILARSLQQLREVTDVARRLNTAETERELERCQNDWACRRMDICRARLKRDPSLAHLRMVLSEAMYDAGLYEGAIEELAPIINNDDFSSTAHLIKGRCLLQMGKDVDAMSELRAASLRRSSPSPPRIRVIALRLLCETAERMGVSLTLAQYRQHLEKAEQDLASEMASN